MGAATSGEVRLIDGGALVDPYGWVDGAQSPVAILLAPTIEGVAPLPEITPPMSAPQWLQVFASTSDFPVALDAARAVASTSATTVWADATDTTCVAVQLAGEAERLEPALQAWQAAAPATRTVIPSPEAADGGPQTALLQACDPGAAAVPIPLATADNAVRSVGQIIDGEAWALDRSQPRLFGRCRVQHLYGVGIIGPQSTTEELTRALDDLDPETCS